MTSSKGRSSALIFVLVVVWLDSLAQSISFPILPRLAQQMLGGDPAAAARWVGYLEVAWAIPQVLAATVLGRLSDRFGRRPVIILSVFGVGVELVAGALAPSIGWLMLARVLCGITCGGGAAAMAYVADVTPADERAGKFGWINAAVWCGVILGPAIGGLLAVVGLRAPFWAAAGFSLAAGVWGLFVLPESLPREGRAPLSWKGLTPLAGVGILLRGKGLAPLTVALLFTWLAFQAQSNMVVLYTAHRYGWSALTFGIFAAVLAVGSILVQGRGAGWIARRLGERRAVLGGLALQGLGMLAQGLSPTTALFCAANVPSVLGGVATPSLQALMSAKVGPEEQGALQGAIASIASLTSVIAPIVLTQLFAWSIEGRRPESWSGATMVLAAGFTVVALAVVAGTRSPPSVVIPDEAKRRSGTAGSADRQTP